MRLALFAATIVLMGILGEVILRTWVPLGTIVYRLDEDHLHEYVPGSRKLFIHSAANGGDWIPVEINRSGFRGEPIGPKGDRPRVVVFGDSFVAAEFTPLEETYVVRLGAALEAELGRPVETINAGVTAYGPDQIARRMPLLLARLEPDILVLAVTAGNDFGDLLRNKLYALDEKGGARERPHTVSKRLRRNFDPARQNELAWKRLWRAVRHSVAGMAGGDVEPQHPRAANLLNRCHHDYVERDAAEVTNLFHDQYDADLSLMPESDASVYKRKLMVGVLGVIAETARSASVPLLVVAIPAAIDVKEDHYGIDVSWADYVEYERSGLTDHVTRAATGHYMEVLDLFPVFRRTMDPDALYFAVGNDHWNPRGQALAAEATASRLAPMMAR